MIFHLPATAFLNITEFGRLILAFIFLSIVFILSTMLSFMDIIPTWAIFDHNVWHLATFFFCFYCWCLLSLQVELIELLVNIFLITFYEKHFQREKLTDFTQRKIALFGGTNNCELFIKDLIIHYHDANYKYIESFNVHYIHHNKNGWRVHSCFTRASEKKYFIKHNLVFNVLIWVILTFILKLSLYVN